MRTRKKQGTPISKLLNCRNGKLKGDLRIVLKDEEKTETSDYKSTAARTCRSVSALAVMSLLAVILH